MQDNNIQKQSDDEIDLIELAKTLWSGRKIVLKTILLFITIGLFVAIFSEKEYTASCIMVPQSSEGGSKLGGSLGGLAAMAGINLGSMGGGSAIPPTLYPKIVKSIPYQKKLIQTQLTMSENDVKVSFEDYYLKLKKTNFISYIKKYTIGLPGVILKNIRSDRGQKHHKEEVVEGLLHVSEKERKLISILSTKLSLSINEKDGYIVLSARMPEAKAAAELTQSAQVLLQNAIKEFKIQKAYEQLVFVEKRFNEKKNETKVAQQKLATFRDRNKNVTTAIAQTELERLTAEYNLVYGVYSELAKQLEQKKILVKEDTPVFTIIEPVTIPLERSKPIRSLIVLIWTMSGVFIGIGIVFGRNFFVKIKKKWNETI